VFLDNFFRSMWSSRFAVLTILRRIWKLIVQNHLLLFVISWLFYKSFKNHFSMFPCALRETREEREHDWKSVATAEYYSQCNKVMDFGRAASALANSTSSVAGTFPLAVLWQNASKFTIIWIIGRWLFFKFDLYWGGENTRRVWESRAVGEKLGKAIFKA
jgi:hypothetical protein